MIRGRQPFVGYYSWEAEEFESSAVFIERQRLS